MMMLTIYGLPAAVKYYDLKALIKQECHISDFVLDNLTGDVDGSKKVRIGVADESEGAHLSKCLNGFNMGGSVLRVTPVGKPAGNQPQNNFDMRGGGFMTNQPGHFGNPTGNFSSQPGNFNNQPGNFNHQQNHPGPWGSAPQSNQWIPNQQPHNQMQQNNFDYQQRHNQQFSPKQQPGPPVPRPGAKPFQSGPFNQGRPAPEQGFGFTPETNVPPQVTPQRRPERSHMLRNVEMTQGAGGRYPDRGNPVTINKNFFQGPNQFDGQKSYPRQEPNNHSSWNKPTPQQKPSSFGKPDLPTFENKREIPEDFDKTRPALHGAPERRLSPHGRVPDRRISPGRRVSPPGRRVSPTGRRASPSGRRASPTGRRASPTGRRASPSGRRASPTGRRASPTGRRASPTGRRASPTGRRMSPGRRISPGRRMSPRRKSPARQSPSRRLESPPRDTGRYSPRRHDKPEYEGRGASKQVRPAYEPEVKAPNQAMYSGGYRPNEKMPYPPRQGERSSPWQDRDKNVYPGMKKPDDDRRMTRGGEPEAKRSPMRKSRSPSRRDGRERSPLRDRYRRHSPSPRSPRRSWALEKRRSPEVNEAPPPPVWPGQNQEDPYGRSTGKPDPTKHVPVWNHRSYEETEEELRRENRSYIEERLRREASLRDMTAPVSRRELSPRRHGFKPPEERINRNPKFEQRDPKFAPHAKFEPRDPKFEPRDPKFELRDPKFEQQNTKFDAREPNFEPHNSRFDQRDPKFQQHVSRFDQREPKFETRDPKFEPRDPKFEMRDPKFEPRDPKFDSRDPKFQPHMSRFGTHEPKFEPRAPTFEARDPKFDHRDTKFDNRGPNFEPRGNEFSSGFQPIGPKFQPRDPDFEPRGLKFGPRESTYEQHDRKPIFEPVDPKFQQRESKFEPRESKYESRDPKFETRDHKFERDDFKDHNPRHDISERKNYPDRDKFRDYQRSEPHREDFRRGEENQDIRKAHDIINKEFEDIYKRSLEFKQKVEEMKRGDRSRDREEYSRESRRREAGDDRREMVDSDRRPREDFHNMDIDRGHQDSRPDRNQPGWKRREMPSKRFYLTQAVKTKRDKAVEEISYKLIQKYGNFEMDDEIKDRVNEELKLTLGKLLYELFGDKDVSFIELVVKFNSKYDAKAELKIFEDVMACFPKQHRLMMKRLAQETDRSGIPAKRSAPDSKLKEDVVPAKVNEAFRPRVKANVRPLKKPVPVKRPFVKAFAAPKHKVVEPVQKRPAPPAAAAAGTVTLDANAARALEAALQQVMIEVWQQLPDEASAEEESAALEIMRNEVSDDLRNALGLNVTKRLLNTFNPLNVKVHFSTKPERKFLSLFLKRYNFVAFKRIVTMTNTFAAQVKTIANYDDLCSNKKIFCGTAKLTITPCYRFTQCPKNLKTVYSSQLDDTTASLKECSEKKSETTGIIVETASKAVVVKDEIALDDDNYSLKKEMAVKSNLVEKKSTGNVEDNVAKGVGKITNIATQTTVTETDTTTKKATNVSKTNAAIESKIDTNSTKTAQGMKVEKSAITKKTENKTADVLVVKSTIVTAADKPLKTINQAVNIKPNVTVTNSTNLKTLNLPTSKATVTPAANKTPAITTAATPNKSQAQTTATTVSANKVPTKSTDTTVAPDKTPAKSTETKAPAKVTNVIVTPNKTPAKPTETKVAANATAAKPTEVIVTPNKSPVNKATKTIVNAKPAQNIAKPSQITVTPNKTPAKPAATKVTANAVPVKATGTIITPNKTPVNKATKTIANAKPAQNKAKIAATTKPTPKITNTPSKPGQGKAKPAATSKPSPKKRSAKNTKNAPQDDDYEELDDHGLYLYLMSAGIVLDECSGSDDE